MANADPFSLLTASKAAPKAASKADSNDAFVLSARSTLLNHRVALDLLYDDKDNKTIPDNTGNHCISVGYKLGNYRVQGSVACGESEGGRGGDNLPRIAILTAVGCVCSGVAFVFLWKWFSNK